MCLADIRNSIGFIASSRFRVYDLQLRITAVDHRRSKTNSPYSVFKLADCSGETTGVLWWDKQQWTTLSYHLGDIVTVSGEFIDKKNGYVLNIFGIQLTDPSRIKPECLLPITWTPEAVRHYSEQFCWLHGQIQDRYLREFVVDSLMNATVALGYCSGQGSLKYHHNWPGGLLQHSVELAMNLTRQAGNLSSSDRDVGLVVALLHDIGKAVTTAGGCRTPLGRNQPHDMTALEVLAQPLTRLDGKNSSAANGIRCFFKPSGWFPRGTPEAVSLVRQLDRSSSFIAKAPELSAL